MKAKVNVLKCITVIKANKKQSVKETYVIGSNIDGITPKTMADVKKVVEDAIIPEIITDMDFSSFIKVKPMAAVRETITVDIPTKALDLNLIFTSRFSKVDNIVVVDGNFNGNIDAIKTDLGFTGDVSNG